MSNKRENREKGRVVFFIIWGDAQSWGEIGRKGKVLAEKADLACQSTPGICEGMKTDTHHLRFSLPYFTIN